MHQLTVLCCLLTVLSQGTAVYNYLGRHSHASLSQKQCSLSFFGKSVLAHLSSAQSKLASLQNLMDFKIPMDPTTDFYTLPEWDFHNEDWTSWTWNRVPYLLSANTKDVASVCAARGGILPRPTSNDRGILLRLLARANLTTQVVSATWEAGGLTFPDGLRGANLPALFDLSGSTKTLKADALNQIIDRFDSFWEYNPKENTLFNFPASKLDVPTKAFCLVPVTKKSRSLANPGSVAVMAARIKNRLKALSENLESYSTKLKLSQLDLTKTSLPADSGAFPTFSRALDEFLWDLQLCFYQSSCHLTDAATLDQIGALLGEISAAVTQLDLGFFGALEGSCQITNSQRLSCVCYDDSETWVKLNFEPTAVSNRILAFNHIIYRADNAKPLEGSCVYKSNSKFFLLTEKCCQLVLLANDEAVSYCPSYYIENFSSAILDNNLLRVDAAVPVSISKDCQLVKNSREISGTDALMLSTCDLGLVTKLGRYLIKSFGNFNIEKLLGSEPETLPPKDIALYAVCAAVAFLLLIIGLWLFTYYYKGGKYFMCICFKPRQTLEPISHTYQPEAVPLSSFEQRRLNLQPSITYR